MRYDAERHRRRSLRLRGYDYSQPGAYFVTICSDNRLPLFGEVVDGLMQLNAYGAIVWEEWFRSAEIRQEIELFPEEFVVMPNHIHGIVWIVESHHVESHDVGANDMAQENDVARANDVAGANDVARANDVAGANKIVGATGRSPLQNPTHQPKTHQPERSPLQNPTHQPERSPLQNPTHQPKTPQPERAPLQNPMHQPKTHQPERSPLQNPTHQPKTHQPKTPQPERAPLQNPTHLTRARGPHKRSLSSFIAGFKAATTKRINEMRGTQGLPVWQRNYYEHVIRNDESLNRIRQYIATNPLRWAMDRENANRRAIDEFDQWLDSVEERGDAHAR